MISSSVGLCQPIKYSYEIPDYRVREPLGENNLNQI